MDTEKLLLLSTLTSKAREQSEDHDKLIAFVSSLQSTADLAEDLDGTKKIWASMFKLYTDLLKTENED